MKKVSIYLGMAFMMACLFCACGNGNNKGYAEGEKTKQSESGSAQNMVDIDLVGKFVANENDEIKFENDGNYTHVYSVEGSDPYVVFGKYEKKDGKYVLYDIDLFDSDEKIVYADAVALEEDMIKVYFHEMKREMTYKREKGEIGEEK